MPEPGGVITKETVDVFVWREVCQGWTVHDIPGLHIIRERMPPRTFELRHAHQRTHQLYFVLEGRATIERGTDLFEVAGGEALEIPADVPHKMRNDSDGDLEFLVVSNGRPREDRTDLE